MTLAHVGGRCARPFAAGGRSTDRRPTGLYKVSETYATGHVLEPRERTVERAQRRVAGQHCDLSAPAQSNASANAARTSNGSNARAASSGSVL